MQILRQTISFGRGVLKTKPDFAELEEAMFQQIVLLFFLVTLTACTGGNTVTTSLGLESSAPTISQQKQTTSDLIINLQNHTVSFSVSCESGARRVEGKGASNATASGALTSSDWTILATGDCQDDVFQVDWALSDQQFAAVPFTMDIRLVSDSGITRALQVQVVKTTVLSDQQEARFDSFSGYTYRRQTTIQLQSHFQQTGGQEGAISAAQYYLTTEAGCSAGGTWQAFSSQINYSLPHANATNTVYVKFRDRGLNETSCISAAVVHDDVGPVAVTFARRSPLIRGSTTAFDLVASGDVAEMKISDGASCVGGTWEDYSTERLDWTVLDANATNIASVVFRDRAHNESYCLSTSFIHDDIPPGRPLGSMPFTTSPGRLANPVFRLQQIAAQDEVRLFWDGACTNQYQTLVSSGSDILLNPTVTEGLNQIFAQVADPAGNISECYGPLISYVYDITPPTVTGTGHPTLATSNKINFVETLSAPGASVIRWKMSSGTASVCGTSSDWSTWLPVGTNPTVDLTSLADGSVTLCLQSKDLAGNEQVTPTSYSWTKNTSSVMAELVTSTLPASPSNVTSLAIQVAGTFVVDYKYKIGAAGTTDCTSTTGYSASFISVSQPITNSIADNTLYPQGPIKLCLIGRNAALVEQGVGVATEYTWTKDTVPPTVLAVSSTPSAGTYYIGMDLVFQVKWSEPVQVPFTVNGRMNILFNGASTKTAYYARQVSSDTLEYRYSILAGDTGSVGYSNSLGIPADSLKDLAGNSNGATSTVTAVTALSGVSVSNSQLSVDFTNDLSFASEASGVGTLSLTATDSARPITVFYRMDNENAESGVDFNLSKAGSFVIPAHTTSYSLDVPILDNNLTQGGKKLRFDLIGTDSGAKIGGVKKMSTLNIQDDETPSFVDFVMLPNAVVLLGQDGTVFSMGSTIAVLGRGTNPELTLVPTRVPGLTGVTEIFPLGGGVCARTSSGIYCWGPNTYRQLGTAGTSTAALYSPTLTDLPANAMIIGGDRMKIGSGTSNKDRGGMGSCYRTSTQVGAAVTCWGYCHTSSFSAPGASCSNTLYSVSPTRYSAFDGVDEYTESIAGNNYDYSLRCGLIADQNLTSGKRVKCVGIGTYPPDGTSGSGPVEIPSLLGSKVLITRTYDSNVSHYAVGDFDGDLTNGDEVKSWGSNHYLQLGVVLASGMYTTTPTLIPDLHQVRKLLPLHDLTSYWGGACVLADNDSGAPGDEVYCWGTGDGVGLGAGLTSAVPARVGGSTLTQIVNLLSSTGYREGDQICAEKDVGSGQFQLWCWGNGVYTPVLVATEAERFIQVELGLYRTQSGKLVNFVTNTVIAATGAGTLKNVDSTYLKTCFLIDGKLACLGTDLSWGLYTGTTTAYRLFAAGVVDHLAGDGGQLCFDFGLDNWSCVAAGTSAYRFGIPATYSSSIVGLLQSQSPRGSKLTFGNSSLCGIDSNQEMSCRGSVNGATTAQGKGLGKVQQNGGYYPTWGWALLANKTPYFLGSSLAAITEVTSLEGVISMQTHSSFVCALLANTGVKCWSAIDNSNNVLGDGRVSGFTEKNLVPDTTGATALALSSSRSCALVGTQLYCWGLGYHQTPLSTDATTQVGPVFVAGGVLDFKLNTISLCFRSTSRDLFCAKSSAFYPTRPGFSATPTVTDVEEYEFGSTSGSGCAKKTNGEVWCWGAQPYQFGKGGPLGTLEYYQ